MHLTHTKKYVALLITKCKKAVTVVAEINYAAMLMPLCCHGRVLELVTVLGVNSLAFVGFSYTSANKSLSRFYQLLSLQDILVLQMDLQENLFGSIPWII